MAIGAAVEAGGTKLAGASLDFRSRSGQWARWGLRSSYCPASAGDTTVIRVCSFDQTGARAFRQNVEGL